MGWKWPPWRSGDKPHGYDDDEKKPLLLGEEQPNAAPRQPSGNSATGFWRLFSCFKPKQALAKQPQQPPKKTDNIPQMVTPLPPSASPQVAPKPLPTAEELTQSQLNNCHRLLVCAKSLYNIAKNLYECIPKAFAFGRGKESEAKAWFAIFPEISQLEIFTARLPNDASALTYEQASELLETMCDWYVELERLTLACLSDIEKCGFQFLPTAVNRIYYTKWLQNISREAFRIYGSEREECQKFDFFVTTAIVKALYPNGIGACPDSGAIDVSKYGLDTGFVSSSKLSFAVLVKIVNKGRDTPPSIACILFCLLLWGSLKSISGDHLIVMMNALNSNAYLYIDSLASPGVSCEEIIDLDNEFAEKFSVLIDDLLNPQPAQSDIGALSLFSGICKLAAMTENGQTIIYTDAASKERVANEFYNFIVTLQTSIFFYTGSDYNLNHLVL